MMEYADYVNEDTRAIYLFGSITAKSTAHIVRGILELSASKSAPIVLFINSPGGDAQEALAIYDALKIAPATVVGMVVGQCSSAASTVLQGCSKRFISPESRFMIHAGTFSVGREHPVEALANAQEYMLLGDVHDKILAERSGKTKAEVTEMSKFAVFMSAEETVTSGFADKVIRKISIPAKKSSKKRK